MFCVVGHGQESEFISGTLIDTVNTEPIPFASIRVKNRAVGVISNNDGSFRIPIKFRELNDTLEITSMGYEIYLKPMLIQLDEVTLSASNKRGRGRNDEVRPVTAEEIISKAIEKIPLNYPFNPQSYVGYYRDCQRKAGG